MVDICKFTVIKCSYTKSFKMAEAVRFELTEHFYSTVFKTVAINRTLPHFHFLAGVIGFEPMMTISKTVALDQLGDTPTSDTNF